jgi:hypothetical protein
MKVLKVKSLGILKVKRTLVLLGLVVLSVASCDNQYKTITKAELTDKIKGGWAGKMIGVMYGLPFEYKAKGTIIEEDILWKPEQVEGALNDDDLYVQMVLLASMGKNQGLKTSVVQMGLDFAHADLALCHANTQACKNILDGIMPPLSGHPKYNMHADDVDFRIGSDFIGFMNPGMPHSAALMADSVGRIQVYGDGVYSGMFVSTMLSLAFFEKDVKIIVEQAMKSIPAESKCAKANQTVIDQYRLNPKDWRKTWAILQEKYGEDDICVPFHPFSIDASLHCAYIVMSLLYGENEMQKSMEIAVRSGQDCDCTAANVGAVFGVMYGYDAIDENWKSHIPKMEDKPFYQNDYTYKKAVSQTLIFAEENILNNGGSVKKDVFKVKMQTPRFTGVLEQSFPGKIASYQVPVTSRDQYTITGNWEDGSTMDSPLKVSTKPGDIFEIKFKGTGITIKGRYDTDGGTAMAYIDGKPFREFNCYYPGWDCAGWITNTYHLIHAMDLEDGEHVLRIEVLDKKHPNSTGHKIYIDRAVVYKNK